MLNYKAREKVKALYRPIMADKELPMYLRVEAAGHILSALFDRSCESYLKGHKYPSFGDPIFYATTYGHPEFGLYVAMLLNQGANILSIPVDVYNVLVNTYGKKKGISKGSYFMGGEVNNIE
jgi:hypothetical protein